MKTSSAAALFSLFLFGTSCGPTGSLDAGPEDLAPGDGQLADGLQTCGDAIKADGGMRASTGTKLSDGWGLWSNGSLTFSKRVTTERQLLVLAKGDFALGEWPLMHVRMGGKLLTSHRVKKSEWTYYSVMLPEGTSGEQSFSIEFANDALDATGDRNLRVRSATFSCGDAVAPVPSGTGTHKGSGPAVHMELKDEDGEIVCKAYDTDPYSPPVATGCPLGTYREQLFDGDWKQLGGDTPVTIEGAPSDAPVDDEIRNDNPRFRMFEDVRSEDLVVNELTDEVTKFDDGSAAIPNTPGDGNFRATCQFSHFNYDDPILYPGEPGRAHLHMFYGNTRTDAFSTKDSLVNSGGGSCNGFELNRSAYWSPALLDTQGNAVVPESIILYYKAKDTSKVQRMPQGLELIAGNTSDKPYFEKSSNLFWSCGKSGFATKKSSTIPADCGDEPINATIYFPQCWDGVNLKYDKDNPHVFQLEHTTDTCPPEFPVLLPQLGVLIYYPKQTNTARWRLSSDSKYTAYPGGTLHADWVGAWHEDTMDRWIDNCLKNQRNCTFGQTGTDRTLKRLYGGQSDDWTGPTFFPIPKNTGGAGHQH